MCLFLCIRIIYSGFICTLNSSALVISYRILITDFFIGVSVMLIVFCFSLFHTTRQVERGNGMLS
jgi:hypothetical protein